MRGLNSLPRLVRKQRKVPLLTSGRDSDAFFSPTSSSDGCDDHKADRASGFAASAFALGTRWQVRENGTAAKRCSRKEGHGVGMGRLSCKEASRWHSW
jgi:hypothetical protein